MSEAIFAADSPVVDAVIASPNYGERRENAAIDMLVLHYTGMPDADQACRWLCNPESEVSSHYFVYEDGRVLQLVPEAQRAWHAGAGSWKGTGDINSRSIGIEISNPGHPAGCPPFPEGQVQAVIALCQDILARNRIAAELVLGHSDTSPGRKVDPGEAFPWAQLHAEGVGHHVPPAPIMDGTFLQEGDQGDPVAALQAMLAYYGYGIEINGTFDASTKAVVAAFQQHFRQRRADGVADVSTVQTLHALARSIPS